MNCSLNSVLRIIEINMMSRWYKKVSAYTIARLNKPEIPKIIVMFVCKGRKKKRERSEVIFS